MPGWLMSGMMGLGVAIFRLRGGRMTNQGMPVLLLSTVGARSGKRRRALLGSIPDGSNARLVTATSGGSAWHPSWFLNLAAHPDRVWVELEGRGMQVRPESLSGAVRDAAWQRIVAVAPGYAAYARKTDRLIPVVRLTALDTTAP